MLNKTVKVTNPVGLHARPATYFTQKANEYKCSISVEKDDRRVNANHLITRRDIHRRKYRDNRAE